MELFGVLCAILFGTVIAAIMACLPALHIYNVAGLVLIFCYPMITTGAFPTSMLIAFMMSLIVAYSVLNTIPSIFLGAPDESAVFITMPGNRALMLGKGYEAGMLTGIGSLGGLLFLLLFALIAPKLLPKIREVCGPHMHWLLASILAFMVMSEWPKGENREPTGWLRFWNAWKNLFAGLLTLLLSGILGFIVMYKPLMPVDVAFQNIMPAFVGLFAIPWVLQNLLSDTEPPPQYISKTVDINPRLFIRGSAAGFLGGLFAAIFPIITGGIGGLLAGHATAQRDDRLFIISQGASKFVYYVGGFLLLFVPGANRAKGGMSAMISSFYQPMGSYGDYYMAIAVVCLSTALSFYLLSLFSKGTIRLIQVVNYRIISAVTMVFILIVVVFMAGWEGLVILAVSSGIGMVPVFFHSRRMNCMGVLLIPVTLNMAGYGPTVAGWLGLL